MTNSFLLKAAAVVIALSLSFPTTAKNKPPSTAPATTTTATVTAEEKEAAYSQAIEKRAQDILASLDQMDPAKAAKVHDAIIAQYRALRDWHDANDPKLKEWAKQSEDKSAQEQTASIKAALSAQHDRFIARLSAELPPAQVDAIKDKMTYNKVQVTFDAYCDIVPNLTEPEKAKILELLKEAREEAMDGGSAEEKSAIFKKYKGKIANYLNAQGHDVTKAYKDWGERQKKKTAN
jgi:hypothetical protein